MAFDEDDELSPWEQFERAQKEQVPDSLPEAGERLLTFWHQLMQGTFTGHAFGASQTTVARLLKILSDADLLLPKLFGCGAIRTGLWFDPKFALEQARDLEQEMGESSVPVETLRQVAESWLAMPELKNVPPLTPHFLMAAMLYWSQGEEFAWPIYQKMLPRIVNVQFGELLQRLHMLGAPGRVDNMQKTVDAVAKLPVKVAAPVFVRFESDTGDVTRDFGPYVWVQTVHDEVKVAPSGRHLATLERDVSDPCWIVSDPTVPHGARYANMIIGPAEVPDGWVQPEDEPSGSAG